MSLCFIDCETTGTDPERHCVWEIGIITDSGEYEWILELTEDERAAAEPMALSIGQYYERSQAAQEDYYQRYMQKFPPLGGQTKETEREGMAEIKYISYRERNLLARFLAEEINRSHLVGAVPGFDARFVGDFMRTHKYPPSWHYHLVDVEALVAGKLQLEPPWSSQTLYRELGIDSSYFSEHTALGDARMAKTVYELVMGKKLTYPNALILEDEREELPVSS